MLQATRFFPRDLNLVLCHSFLFLLVYVDTISHKSADSGAGGAGPRRRPGPARGQTHEAAAEGVRRARAARARVMRAPALPPSSHVSAVLALR